MENSGLVPPNAIFSFVVTKNDVGNRVDKYITRKFSSYSRSFFQRLIEQQRVTINSISISKYSVMLKESDVVRVQFPPVRIVKAREAIQKNLGVYSFYEHQHFLVIYKPENLLVHPPSPMSGAISLIDWIVLNYQEIAHIGYVDRPGIVHRLDKDTSGLLIIARTNYGHAMFNTLFKDHAIDKVYYALVQGHPDRSGSITFPIGRDPAIRTRMRVQQLSDTCQMQKVRSALTYYTVLEYFDDCSLVKVHPVTGRTHQIRVHFAAIKHPLVGDVVYGKRSKLIARQALHAYSLSFRFEGKRFSFMSELPDDFSQLLKKLRCNKA